MGSFPKIGMNKKYSKPPPRPSFKLNKKSFFWRLATFHSAKRFASLQQVAVFRHSCASGWVAVSAFGFFEIRMWRKQSIQQLVVNRSKMIAHEVGPVKDFYYKDVYLEKVRFLNKIICRVKSSEKSVGALGSHPTPLTKHQGSAPFRPEDQGIPSVKNLLPSRFSGC